MAHLLRDGSIFPRLAPLCVAASTWALAASAGASPPRGYQERACGFDLDDDGEVGEPEDDCRICDGATADPDGDGVDEDLIYVDCDGGSDSASCGDAASPCATVTHALESRMNGPADGAEDIVCFTGTCAPERVRPAFGGLTDTRIVPQSGFEARDFELATDPAMLVGWDRDADGEYPPYDDDDVSVLDGTGLDWAIWMRNSTSSHFEFAHFSAEEYGRTGTGGGFYVNGTSHNYLHDLSLNNIAREMPTPSGRIVLDFFTSQNNHYFWLKNVECQHCGGRIALGSSGDGPAEGGPFRFQGITFVMHPCSYGSSAACDAQPYAKVAKMWGYTRGVEFLDSYFDGDPTNRVLGNHPSHWPGGVTAANCAQDFVVRNNTFHDASGLTVQGYAAGFCVGAGVTRPTSDIVFEHNLVEFEELDRAIAAVNLQPVGQIADANVGNVTVRDNIFRSTAQGGMRSCMAYSAGNTVDQPDGQIVFEGNRCEGAAGEAIRLIASAGATLHQDFVVSDNVFVGADSFVNTGYGPSGFTSDDNIFGGAGNFRWDNGPASDLPGFQAASGTNAASEHCPDESCVPVTTCGDGTCDPDEDCEVCPEDCGGPIEPNDDGGTDDDGGDTGADDDTGIDGDGDEAGTAAGDAGTTGGFDGATGGGADAGNGADPGLDGSSDGCGCRSGRRDRPWTVLALVGALGLLRRRRFAPR
ncbi:MAG: hypothetical protein AAF721_05850 [Myxococcota bacterium]